MQTKTLTVVGGGIVVVAVAAAVYLRPIQDQIRADRTQAAEASVQAPVAADPVAADPVDTTLTEAEPVEVAVPVGPTLPDLPVVTDRRFEGDGALLVSGMAPAGTPVAVMIDGIEVERVDVAADGSFVVIGFIGFSDSPRRMELVSDPDGAAVRSDRSFILDANPTPVIVAAVEDSPGATPVSQDPITEDPVVSETVASIEGDAPDQDIADNAAAPAEVAVIDPISPDPDPAPTSTNADEETSLAEVASPEPETSEDAAPVVAEADPITETPAASPAILEISEDGVEVVQPPIAFGTPPEVMSNVALDTITYDPEGDVELRGRATGSGFVQVYVNNAPISRLPIDEDGSWRGDLPNVDTGIYTLRIDEVDPAGEVVSRIETPFLREDPDDVVEAMADDVADPSFTVATRTVQPGATLWAIAEERYGSGVLYVALFEANKDRIRDPDLIYPGQVFMIPDAVTDTATGNN